jgi:hypothetical protein
VLSKPALNELASLAPSNLTQAVWQTLAYADVFDYPMTAPEVHRYLNAFPARYNAVMECLERERSLQRDGEMFALPGRGELFETRRRRAQAAAWLWPRACHFGQQIAALPFVSMLAVTGALAMDNVDAGADIDYLVVTMPGRLWTCRALIILVGRLAARQGATLCPNYLVSLHALKFPDQNLYAAHEVAQMVPLAGLEVYAQIRRLNAWVQDFLPNADGAPPDHPLCLERQPFTVFRRFLERTMRAAPFDHLEHWEMDRKIRRLGSEQRFNPEAGFSPEYCKGHANRHLEKTRQALDERLQRLEFK